MELRKRVKNTNRDENIQESTGKFQDHSFVLSNALPISLLVRLSAVIFTQSYFVPDEYWQSTEIAHRNVFGNGYVSWEWSEKIRSYFYPCFFEIYYRILIAFGIHHRVFVYIGPHIIQSIFSSFGDFALLHFCNKVFKYQRIVELTFFMQLCSWFIYYTCSRTLSDTMSTCLNLFALSFLPNDILNINNNKQQNSERSNISLVFFFAGLSCIIRPHVIVLWLSLVIFFLLEKRLNFFTVLFYGLKMAVVVLFLQLVVDYYYFGQLTFPHWNFLAFNVIKKGSALFGTHPFHWYFTQGLPVVLGLCIVTIPLGMIKYTEKSFLFSAIIYIAVLSLIPHKEFRFLLPSVPLLMPYCGHGLYTIMEKVGYAAKTFIIVLFIAVNVFTAGFFCMIHQRGSIDVIHHIGEIASKETNTSVIFLMPCHSTPYYSYVHNNIYMRFLTCQPSFDESYTNEADLFFRNPNKWLESNDVLSTATHVVAFDNLKRIEKRLSNHGFLKKKTFFHTLIPEGRISKYINVYEK